jgi:hypothetical protein
MRKKSLAKAFQKETKALEKKAGEVIPGEAIIAKDNEEIVVHWVNKYGVHMDIKTMKGGIIHTLWLAEHERRSRKKIADDNVIEIQPEIISCHTKQLPDADRPNP